MKWNKEIYNDINNLKNPKIINENWSQTGGIAPKSSLHSIASYLAMFAPALPEYFINRYSNEGDLIFDPFSGRGTTALRSRELNRKFVGSDLNPYSLVLSRFKISKLKKNNLLIRLKYWEKKFEKSKKIWFEKTYEKKYCELLYYYNRETLSKLIFIRKKIGKKWKNTSILDNALLAIITGIMHGPSRKNGDTIYFSVSMPNSISMAPNYVKNYVKKNNLKIPNVNVFKKIQNRINIKFDKILEKKFMGNIYNYNATKKNEYIKNNSVNLVITSPPYLSIVDYTKSNWLKLWILGYDRKNLKKDIRLDDNLKFNEYINFIQKFLNNIHHKLKIKAKVCLVVGDVHNTKLIEKVWKKIKNNVKYKFIEIFYDTSYLQERKVTNMLNSRMGKATIIEKVLVVEKV